jgi:Family of unknown function (DUF5681)
VSDTSERSRSPRTGRFQKGHSGNPKGRPRKQRVLRDAPRSAFEIVLEKRVTVTQAGIDQELSVEEALQLRTYQDALAGKRAARREVLKMIAKREKAMADREVRTPQTRPSVPVKTSPDPRNADAAMCLLGIAAPNKSREEYDPDAILLEPWAVQAALRRRRGSKALTMEDVDDIQRCTRAPETLRWPRRTIT